MSRRVWFLHGILGRGRNWRSFARRFEQERGWRVTTPDLRCHGDAPPRSPPHDLAACARDLEELAAAEGAPDVIVGHSFGGKVALACVERLSPQVTWVLDAPPGPVVERPASSDDPARILELLRGIPVAPTRGELGRPLLDAGISDAIVAWLLTSTRSDDRGWSFVWDLDGVEEMLRSYAATDFWPLLRSTDRTVHLVRAGRSDRWSSTELEDLRTLHPPVSVHLLADAGHWLQVDDPEGLFRLLDRSL